MSTESSVADKVVGGTDTEVQRLAVLVRRLLSEWEQYRRRVTTAEARVKELEAALRDVTTGGVDPLALAQRVQALEQENRFLARRLDRARESVKRISARLQFLDEDR
jgi:predicted RNase H-like nuclease (RuvC/YqgF family)